MWRRGKSFFKDTTESRFPCALQMTSPTALRVSPRRCSASMSQPWRRTPPTSSGLSFEPCGCPTPVPRETSRGLSSTRCVNWPFISTVSWTRGVMRSSSLRRPNATRLYVNGKDENIYNRASNLLSPLFKCWSLFHVLTVKWILH